MHGQHRISSESCKIAPEYGNNVSAHSAVCASECLENNAKRQIAGFSKYDVTLTSKAYWAAFFRPRLHVSHIWSDLLNLSTDQISQGHSKLFIQGNLDTNYLLLFLRCKKQGALGKTASQKQRDVNCNNNWLKKIISRPEVRLEYIRKIGRERGLS